MSQSLAVERLTSPELAYTNKVYLSPKNYLEYSRSSRPPNYAMMRDFVYIIDSDPQLKDHQLGVNVAQRESARINLSENITLMPFNPNNYNWVPSVIQIKISTYMQKEEMLQIDGDHLEQVAINELSGHILTKNQIVTMRFEQKNFLKLEVINIMSNQPRENGTRDNNLMSSYRALVMSHGTQFIFEATSNTKISIKSSKFIQKPIFESSFKFEELGVGGLDTQLSEILRRAFSSRALPPNVIKELGIAHVKGMLLHGPPGTGKTLIARQIGKVLRAHDPIIVNGPEILNKYVGQSEENIRNLFSEAEKEYKSKGDNSSLHIIIFDEIDAICKQRGTTSNSTGVQDSIVNQLLAKIDGVEALNNILLIGMTNRIDMIDEALLRPGRLELHVEISLPDEDGRLQILKIHTSDMRKANRLDMSVSLEDMAKQTKNFSGAEIAGLIRSAASFAFERNVDFRKTVATPTNTDNIKVTKHDFESALTEIKPAYGAEEVELENCKPFGIINFGGIVANILNYGKILERQITTSPTTRLISLLLYGKAGTGKTALAAEIAQKTEIPFIKLITPENLMGKGEASQAATILHTFEDAYKSELSLVILDNIERLLGYSKIGPRFSNTIMQIILTVVNKRPPNPKHRLLIISTTSEYDFCRESGIDEAFNMCMEVPLVDIYENINNVFNEYFMGTKYTFAQQDLNKISMRLLEENKPAIPIKTLLTIIDMAAASSEKGFVDFQLFMKSYETITSPKVPKYMTLEENMEETHTNNYFGR